MSLALIANPIPFFGAGIVFAAISVVFAVRFVALNIILTAVIDRSGGYADKRPRGLDEAVREFFFPLPMEMKEMGAYTALLSLSLLIMCMSG